MIDVKEMHEDNEATAQIREEVRKSWREKGGKAEPLFRVGGPYEADTFRDPAEMVTLSVNRFERLVRAEESHKNEIIKLNEKIAKAWEFIDIVAREWAEKGSPIPSYDDLSRMAEILDWKEPYEIHDIRVTQRMIRDQAKKEKEAQENGEAAD